MKQDKVAIVGGIRTPFVKAGGHFASLSMQELGVIVLRELVKRHNLDTAQPDSQIDQFIFSTVLLDPRTPNWAREILFQAGLSKSIYASSVSNNCISGLVAITTAAQEIALQRAHCVIAGGSESMSNPALLFSTQATRNFHAISRVKNISSKLNILRRFRPRDFFPTFPAITEPSTGLTMGQHMELTAKSLDIPRLKQDELALASHKNATDAIQKNKFSRFIVKTANVKSDLLVRHDTSLAKLQTLSPVFDRSVDGTLTAGNSSPLTDGASAVLLMSEERAKRTGQEILGYIVDYEFAAIDPNAGLLMAPAVAVPKLLTRHKLSLEDFTLIEIHEAFAAQVLANIEAWEKCLMGPAIGKCPMEIVNVNGGSIALGHPFAATGGRMLIHLLEELRARATKSPGKPSRGLISICAAGGMAGAMIVEV